MIEADIFYSLRNLAGDPTTGDHNNTRLIVQVLARLPEDVRDDVLENVVFVHTLAQGVMAGWGGDRPGTFIILNFKGMRSDKSKMTTIAHEIAHYRLGQVEGGLDNERTADDLCEEWGFDRAYRSYRRFKDREGTAHD